jgi:hypothetical protein
MIAKAIKGRGFRGALAYDLNKEQGRVIDTNMGGTTPRELAKEFGEVRSLRPKVGKAVLHVSLSASPGEHLSDDQWRQVAAQYLQGMGLENNQYIVTRHLDTEHEHVHLLVNRIRFDGSITSDSHDYRRQEVLMRAIERKYDLQRVPPSIEVHRHAPTKGEIEEGLRTGQPSTRQRLQQLCDAAAKDCDSFSDYAARLEAVDVQLVPVVQLEGRKLSGLSYVLDGVMMKGSDLGKGYSPLGLAKRGVGYDKERDVEAVGRCIERSQAGVTEPTDRTSARSEADQRGRTRDLAGTVGASDGRSDGRNAGEPGAGTRVQQGAKQAVLQADGDRDHGLAQRGDGGAAGGRTAGDSREENRTQSLLAGLSNRSDNGASRERILALAGTGAYCPERAGRERGSGATQSRDRSAEAAQRQLAAIGIDRFVISLVNVRTGRQAERHWHGEDVLKSLSWLKRMNARGYDVRVRPAGEHGLALIVGLAKADLHVLQERGFSPAAVVEVASGQYEAWVKLSHKPLPKSLRDQVAQKLVRGVGIYSEAKVINLAEGRLAGFTNQHVQRTSGLHPFVLLAEADGKVAPAALAYLAKFKQGKARADEPLRYTEQRVRSRGRGR